MSCSDVCLDQNRSVQDRLRHRAGGCLCWLHLWLWLKLSEVPEKVQPFLFFLHGEQTRCSPSWSHDGSFNPAIEQYDNIKIYSFILNSLRVSDLLVSCRNCCQKDLQNKSKMQFAHSFIWSSESSNKMDGLYVIFLSFSLLF